MFHERRWRFGAGFCLEDFVLEKTTCLTSEGSWKSWGKMTPGGVRGYGSREKILRQMGKDDNQGKGIIGDGNIISDKCGAVVPPWDNVVQELFWECRVIGKEWQWQKLFRGVSSESHKVFKN